MPKADSREWVLGDRAASPLYTSYGVCVSFPSSLVVAFLMH